MALPPNQSQRLKWLSFLKSITLRFGLIMSFRIEMLSTMKWFLHAINIYDTKNLRALIVFAHFYRPSNSCPNITPCHVYSMYAKKISWMINGWTTLSTKAKRTTTRELSGGSREGSRRTCLHWGQQCLVLLTWAPPPYFKPGSASNACYMWKVLINIKHGNYFFFNL